MRRANVQFKSYAEVADDYSMEVFCIDSDVGEYLDDDGDPLETGWYWWSCPPGCLPMSDPIGPFDTYQEALDDAVEPLLY